MHRGVAVMAASAAFLAAHAFGAETGKSRHLMVIGLDGVMPDAVKVAAAPNLKKLASEGAVTWDGFAGGVPGTPSHQITDSVQSWNSALTGVWGNKHKARYRFATDHTNYPCLFRHLKEVHPNAYCSSIVSWGVVNDTPSMVPEADWKQQGTNDEHVVDLVVKHLAEKDPACIFVHLGSVDSAGHRHGYGPSIAPYLEAVEKIDGHVGQLVAAVRSRKTYAAESWLFIAVSDHGGRLPPKPGHGGDSPEERTIFIIVAGDEAKKGEVSPGPGIVAIAPTVLRYFGVEIRPEWKLDGEPFGL